MTLLVPKQVANMTHLLARSADPYTPVKPVFDVTILLHASNATWETRAKAIKDTWLSQPIPANMQLFWVLDDNMTNDPTILINHRTKPGVKMRKESVATMDERTIQAFVQVLRLKPPSKWYLKIDDDTFVNVTNLQTTLVSLESNLSPTSVVYAGQCHCWWGVGLQTCYQLYGEGDEICDPLRWLPRDGNSFRAHDTYACGGPGYLLSRGSLEAVVDYEQLHGCPRGLYEDQMIGWVMQGPLNVSCHHIDTLLSTFMDGDLEHWNLRKLVTAHKVLPDSMYRLYSGEMH